MNKSVALSSVVKKTQIVLTIIGLSGIVLPFLPFTWGTTPLDVLLDWDFSDFGWRYAAPCVLLPLPISAGYVFWLKTGRLPRWASLAGLGLSAWFAISILASVALEPDWEIIQLVLLTGAVFAGGLWFGVRGISHNSSVRELVLMQSIFVAPMTFWLLAYASGDMEIGAWLGAVTLLAYSAQLTLAAKRYAFALAVAVPVVGVAIFSLAIDF